MSPAGRSGPDGRSHRELRPCARRPLPFEGVNKWWGNGSGNVSLEPTHERTPEPPREPALKGAPLIRASDRLAWLRRGECTCGAGYRHHGTHRPRIRAMPSGGPEQAGDRRRKWRQAGHGRPRPAASEAPAERDIEGVSASARASARSQESPGDLPLAYLGCRFSGSKAQHTGCFQYVPGDLVAVGVVSAQEDPQQVAALTMPCQLVRLVHHGP